MSVIRKSNEREYDDAVFVYNYQSSFSRLHAPKAFAVGPDGNFDPMSTQGPTTRGQALPAQEQSPSTQGPSRGLTTHQRIEEMKKRREERRQSAEAFKARRAEEAIAAEAVGGVDALEFLHAIQEHRRIKGIAEPVAWEMGTHVWAAEHGPSRTRVCVRKRPMLRTEERKLDFDVVSAEAGHRSLTVHEPKVRVDLSKDVEHHCFGFDACFSEADGNEDIYGAVLEPLIFEHVFCGGQATCFAFGQTGSGKTCTMAGHGDHGRQDGNAVGLYGLAARDVFIAAEQLGYAVGISFFEVYRGLVLDLLGNCARLDVLEDAKGRVTVVGLREVRANSAEEMLGLIKRAEGVRATGATSANETSSRSHAILRVTLREPIPGEWPVVGTLSLVDLAGSERAVDSAYIDEQTKAEVRASSEPRVHRHTLLPLNVPDGSSHNPPPSAPRVCRVLKSTNRFSP